MKLLVHRWPFIMPYACCPTVISITPLFLKNIWIWMMSCTVFLVMGLCLSSTWLGAKLFSKVLYQVTLLPRIYESSHCLSNSVLLAFQISQSGKLCIYLILIRLNSFLLAVWISSFIRFLFKSVPYFFFF